MTSPSGTQVQVPGQGEIPVQIQMPKLGPTASQGPVAHPGAQAQPGPATLDLRDIHPPADPALWPPAPGWWIALGLILAALVLVGQRTWRAHRVRTRRRRILAELAGLGTRTQGAELAAGVSALLKRIALTRFNRAEVAPLTGAAWLDFLDRHGGEGRFAKGPGQVLADGPYAPTPTPTVEAQALLDLAEVWVRRNT
jgi:hypothetical protein